VAAACQQAAQALCLGSRSFYRIGLTVRVDSVPVLADRASEQAALVPKLEDEDLPALRRHLEREAARGAVPDESIAASRAGAVDDGLGQSGLGVARLSFRLADARHPSLSHTMPRRGNVARTRGVVQHAASMQTKVVGSGFERTWVNLRAENGKP